MNKRTHYIVIICAHVLVHAQAMYPSEKRNFILDNEQLRSMIVHRVPYSQDIQHTLDILCGHVQRGEDPLDVLKKIEDLDLCCNTIKDITPLAYLTDLKKLNLRGNQLADISPLYCLTKLEVLDLNDNLIDDIESLTHLRKLKNLNLGNNEIADIAPLSQLTNLQDLNLFCNKIIDIAPIGRLKNLETLDLYGNTIKTMKPLAQLPKLKMHDVQTSFEIACRNGFVKKAHVLISMHGANCNFQDAAGRTPLMTASEFGQEDIVDLLLKNNVAVNMKNEKDETALDVMIGSRLMPKVSIVKKLLEHGADPNNVAFDDQSMRGWRGTCLDGAVSRFSLEAEVLTVFSEIIPLLLAHKATPDRGDMSPLSAIQSFWDDPAYVTKSFEIMKLLIEHGADVNFKCKHLGDTPLHKVIEIGDKRKIQLLLDAGADSSIRSCYGKTPLDMTNDEELISFVKTYKKAAPK